MDYNHKMNLLIEEWKELLNVNSFEEVQAKMKRLIEIADLVNEFAPKAIEELEK